METVIFLRGSPPIGGGSLFSVFGNFDMFVIALKSLC